MCGVVGIIGNSKAAEELWLGLLAIQHRGQDTAGIVTYDKDRFYLKKGKGTVQHLFNAKSLLEMPGNAGIGHVRYPTIGAGAEEDAQPLLTNSPFGITIAHNGNVVNYETLKAWLAQKHYRHINTTNDVEIILNVFAAYLAKSHLDPLEPPVSEFIQASFDAVKKTMSKVNGSYSCVVLIAGQGMLAFRDPHGIRPLKLGIKDKSYCFASESVVLDALKYKEMRDVLPGEAIFIDMNRNLTSKIINADKPKHCIFEHIYFARPDSVMDGVEIYKARFKLGEELAKIVKEQGLKPDVVIPVPDTARTASQGAAEVLKIPCREGLIKNRYIGRTFIMPRDTDRKEQVRYKLNPVKCEIKGKKILLVDDSIVRGSTSKSIISLIREAQPEAIYFASTCPPLKHPCFYGIDMQTRGEFIANGKNVEQIRLEIGADKLIYQSLEGMLGSCLPTDTPGNNNSYCTACFTGDYPTELGSEDVLKDILRIEKERTNQTSIWDK